MLRNVNIVDNILTHQISQSMVRQGFTSMMLFLPLPKEISAHKLLTPFPSFFSGYMATGLKAEHMVSLGNLEVVLFAL